MGQDNGLDAECFEFCPRISALEKELQEMRKTLNRGVYRYCPNCGSGLVRISTKDLLICDCGHKEPFKLKKGQRSILENRIGE